MICLKRCLVYPFFGCVLSLATTFRIVPPGNAGQPETNGEPMRTLHQSRAAGSSPTPIDVGVLYVGEQGESTVTFSNVTGRRLAARAKTSCGCTSAILEKTILEPGETTKLVIRLDTQRMTDRIGPISELIAVYDEAVPKSPVLLQEWKVSLELRTSLTFAPPIIRFQFDPNSLERHEEVISVSNRSAAKITLRPSPVQNGLLEGVVPEAITLAPGESADVKLQFGILRADKTFQGSLDFTGEVLGEDQVHQTHHTIRTLALPDHSVNALPGSILFLGDVDVHHLTRELELRWTGPSIPDKVTLVPDDSNIEIVEVEPKKRYRVVLSSMSSDTPFVGSISVRFAGPTRSGTVEIPVVFCR